MQTIGLLRRYPESVSRRQKDIIIGGLGFKGQDVISFKRLDPANSEEHAALCEEYGIVACMLPGEQQIPTQAMKNGVIHFFLTDDDEVRRLKALSAPVFESKGEKVTESTLTLTLDGREQGVMISLVKEARDKLANRSESCNLTGILNDILAKLEPS